MWQDIETARKDNTGIIGWFPDCRCAFSMVWDEDEGKWWSFGGAGSMEGNGEPTMWMELPVVHYL